MAAHNSDNLYGALNNSGSAAVTDHAATGSNVTAARPNAELSSAHVASYRSAIVTEPAQGEFTDHAATSNDGSTNIAAARTNVLQSRFQLRHT